MALALGPLLRQRLPVTIQARPAFRGVSLGRPGLYHGQARTNDPDEASVRRAGLRARVEPRCPSRGYGSRAPAARGSSAERAPRQARRQARGGFWAWSRSDAFSGLGPVRVEEAVGLQRERLLISKAAAESVRQVSCRSATASSHQPCSVASLAQCRSTSEGTVRDEAAANWRAPATASAARCSSPDSSFAQA